MSELISNLADRRCDPQVIQGLKKKQQDALNALSGGAVFSGQTKKRGFEAFMEKVTSVLLVLFFVFAIILAYMSSK